MQNFLSPQYIQELSQQWWFILLLVAWIIPWKGVALWKAAQNRHKLWFIALLVLNTMAILEILYIFVFSKKVNKKKNE